MVIQLEEMLELIGSTNKDPSEIVTKERRRQRDIFAKKQEEEERG